MNNIKCPNCGLINFASATACKRCKQELEAPSYPYWNAEGAVKPAQPDWSKLQTVPAVPTEAVDLAEYGDGSHPIGNILFAVYLLLNMVALLYALNSLSSASINEVWKAIIDPKSRFYLASFELNYYVLLLGVIVMLPATLILVLTLFRKSKAFLVLVPVYLFAEFVHGAVYVWLMFRLEAEMREKQMPEFQLAADQTQWFPYLGIISILLTVLWFRYFTTSKRARSVFD